MNILTCSGPHVAAGEVILLSLQISNSMPFRFGVIHRIPNQAAVLQIEMILPASVDVVTSYFKNGVELNPGVTEDDKDYWVDRFREIRAKYNPLGMMVNTQGVGLIDADVQIESIESGVDVVSYLPVFSYLPLFFITYT
ncbi:MAG: hypothetical protein ACI90V_001563 [Bacillariaceae sp.]|jgi:hypothetical protein